MVMRIGYIEETDGKKAFFRKENEKNFKKTKKVLDKQN